jgi:hypothetical protein
VAAAGGDEECVRPLANFFFALEMLKKTNSSEDLSNAEK